MLHTIRMTHYAEIELEQLNYDAFTYYATEHSQGKTWINFLINMLIILHPNK